jgi:hypothetical protein
MECCEFIVCKNCLRHTLEHQNNLICMFCKKDHCKSELQYIEIIKPYYCDYDKWIKWWNDYLGILD